nr:hypothetical protein [Parasporobacterium sp.]
MEKYNIENLEKYIENVDKCAWTIANLLRGGVAPDDEHVICATYLGLIIRDNEIKTEEELDEYINRRYSEDLVMFLLHYRPAFE